MFGRTKEPMATYSREWLKKFVADGERFLDAARSYSESMDAAAITVKPGHYYETYNGSVVYLARKRPDEDAPIDPIRALGEMMSAARGEDPEPADPEDSPLDFIAVVLRGGHGVCALRGEGPGDAYLVGPDGQVKLPADKDKKGELPDLSGKLLALVGLTIKKECPAP